MYAMSREKKDYKIMVKQPKVHTIYGCVNPYVKDGNMCCDGNCQMCKYQTIAGIYKEYK